MLLRYLVTSQARRGLLRALWTDGARASVSELARQAGVSFAAAHRELASMRAAGVAACERVGSTLVYRANLDCPEATLLRQLLRAEAAPRRGRTDDEDNEKVRVWLAQLGAPLLVRKPVRGRPAPLEEVLAAALVVAHRDATVARVLPVVLWGQREHLDPGRLVRAATRLNERQALGFFLELTGQLGGDVRLTRMGRRLRDRRRTRPRLFFTAARGPAAVAAARRHSPRLARKWGFLMNLGLDSYASAFAKHTAVA